jgi:hypothetical protein
MKSLSLARNAVKPAGLVRAASTAVPLPEQWAKLAAEDLKGKSVDSLIKTSAEGIPIKPIYTAEDTKNVSKVDKEDLMRPTFLDAIERRQPTLACMQGRRWPMD